MHTSTLVHVAFAQGAIDQPVVVELALNLILDPHSLLLFGLGSGTPTKEAAHTPSHQCLRAWHLQAPPAVPAVSMLPIGRIVGRGGGGVRHGTSMPSSITRSVATSRDTTSYLLLDLIRRTRSQNRR